MEVEGSQAEPTVCSDGSDTESCSEEEEAEKVETGIHIITGIFTLKTIKRMFF